MNFQQTFCKLLTKFLWTSHEHLSSLLESSYKLFTHVKPKPTSQQNFKETFDKSLRKNYLTCECWNRLKILFTDKRSSLFFPCGNDEEKKIVWKQISTLPSIILRFKSQQFSQGRWWWVGQSQNFVKNYFLPKLGSVFFDLAQFAFRTSSFCFLPILIVSMLKNHNSNLCNDHIDCSLAQPACLVLVE
jgi:hypothetical protein